MRDVLLNDLNVRFVYIWKGGFRVWLWYFNVIFVTNS